MLAELRRGDDPLFIGYFKQFWLYDPRCARQKRISEKRPLSIEYPSTINQLSVFTSLLVPS